MRQPEPRKRTAKQPAVRPQGRAALAFARREALKAPAEGGDGQALDNGQEGEESSAPSSQTDQLSQIADLLKGDDPAKGESQKPDTGTPGESPPTKKAKPKNLDELAERLGVKVEDLFAIEFQAAQQGGAKAVTLGELKDSHAKQSDFAIRELKWEEERVAKEGEHQRATEELRDLISMLPKEALKPGIFDKVRERYDSKVALERTRTLELIPAWKDEATRTSDLAGMVEHLAGYGYPKGYLTQVNDSRTLKYIRENWQREKRIREALAKVTEVKTPSTPGTSRPAGGKPPAKGATSSRPTGARASLNNQVSQIAALLK